MSRIKPPFKYYGGKFYLAPWIIGFFPSHKIYLEPFGGGGSVLLNKDKAEREIFNDLDEGVVNVMKAIRDDSVAFIERVNNIQCEESVYYDWKSKECNNDMDRAIRTYVIYRMSRGGAGGSFSKSNRKYRGLPENAAAWETGIKNIPRVSSRLQEVEIRQQDALELMQEFAPDENTLIYCDPPYVPESRKSRSIYNEEMTLEQHEIFLQGCLDSSAKIAISGYQSELYDKMLADWDCHNRLTYLHAGHSAKKPLVNELVWKNFEIGFDNLIESQ